MTVTVAIAATIQVGTVSSMPPTSGDSLDPAELNRLLATVDEIHSSREYRLGEALLRLPRAVARLRHLRTRWASLEPVSQPGFYDVTVALIADRFTTASLRGLVNIVELHPFGWREQLEAAQPDVLLVESAWTGQQNWWRYEVSSRGRRSPDRIAPILEVCRRGSIPSVFWNKEDPTYFTRFFPATRGFDLVATTAIEAVESYEVCGRPRVEVVPFGVNPTLHHPVGPAGSSSGGGVLFPGSWLEERGPETALLLDAAIRAGHLEILSRDGSTFPERFQPHVAGSLSYEATVARTRAADVVLNVNTVSGSETMLSRRVIESLGCGTPVLSSPSPALEQFWPDVRAAGTPQEADHILSEWLGDARAGLTDLDVWRRVHRDHRMDQRIHQVLAALGESTEGLASELTDLDRSDPRASLHHGRTRFVGVWPRAQGRGTADELSVEVATAGLRFGLTPIAAAAAGDLAGTVRIERVDMQSPKVAFFVFDRRVLDDAEIVDFVNGGRARDVTLVGGSPS